MRVTITVEGVQREIEVRPDLLLPGMGEWQDATEMDLLRAFGHAYKEAVARGLAAATDAAHPTHAATQGGEVADVQAAFSDDAHVAPEVPVDLMAEAPNEGHGEFSAAPTAHVPLTDNSGEAVLDYDPEATSVDHPETDAENAIEQTPFATSDDEGFGQVETYIATENDAEAFLSPVPAPAMVTPEVTQCRCGHAIGWHVSEPPEQTGPCLTVWAIDDHDPSGPQARCSCLAFEPADVRPPLV